MNRGLARGSGPHLAGRGAVPGSPARPRRPRRPLHCRSHRPRRHRRLLQAVVPPGNLVVVAAGRLDHAEIVGRVDAVLGGCEAWRAAGPHVRRSSRRLRSPSCATTTEQAHLCLGWRALADDDDDRWALAVANQLLGGGTASRLFQEIREERGLAYSVYSYPTSYSRRRSAHRVLRHRAQAGSRGARRRRRRARQPPRPTDHHRREVAVAARLPRGLTRPRARGQRQLAWAASAATCPARRDHPDRRAPRPARSGASRRRPARVLDRVLRWPSQPRRRRPLRRAACSAIT